MTFETRTVTIDNNCYDSHLFHDISKCEIISYDMTTNGTLLVSLPGTRLERLLDAELLGSPLGDDAKISAVLADKVESLRRLGDRLQLLSTHDALILLRNCFALPKLLYVLRTAPCFRSSTLETYDDCLHEVLPTLVWSQAARHGNKPRFQ